MVDVNHLQKRVEAAEEMLKAAEWLFNDPMFYMIVSIMDKLQKFVGAAEAFAATREE